MSTLQALGTLGGILFLAWAAIRLFVRGVTALAMQDPGYRRAVEGKLVEAQTRFGIDATKARERARRAMNEEQP